MASAKPIAACLIKKNHTHSPGKPEQQIIFQSQQKCDGCADAAPDGIWAMLMDITCERDHKDARCWLTAARGGASLWRRRSLSSGVSTTAPLFPGCRHRARCWTSTRPRRLITQTNPWEHNCDVVGVLNIKPFASHRWFSILFLRINLIVNPTSFTPYTCPLILVHYTVHLWA